MSDFNEKLAEALREFNRKTRADEIRAMLIGNAERICEILEAEGRSDAPTPRCRLDRIRTLPMRALADYLKREIGDSVPTDWLGWLTEPIGKEGQQHEEEPRTP